MLSPFFFGGVFLVQCKSSLAKKLFVDSRDSILIRSLFIHVHKRESDELFAIERKVEEHVFENMAVLVMFLSTSEI